MSITDTITNFHGFITQDSITKKTLKRAHECISHQSRSIWIEGMRGTGKHLLAYIMIEEIGRQHLGRAYTSNELHIGEPPFESRLEALLEEGIESLIIYIPQTRTAQDLRLFQEALTKMLSRQPDKMKLVCFLSLPAMSYERLAAKHIAVLKQLFIQQNYEYLNLHALTNRPQDIDALFRHYLEVFAHMHHGKPPQLADEAMHFLRECQLPRNVIDIQQCCLRMVHNYTGEEVALWQLQDTLNSLSLRCDNRAKQTMQPMADIMTLSLQDNDGKIRSLDDLEAEIIEKAYRYYQGSKSAVARDLGIGRTTLYRKLAAIEENSE